MTAPQVINGKVIRVISLDACGNLPASGTADSMVVTKGVVSIQLSQQVQTGNTATVTLMDGTQESYKARDTFQWFTVQIEFNQVDPAVLSLTSNAEVYEDFNSDPTGFVVPSGLIATQFSLEGWTGTFGAPCAPGVAQQSGYFLLPFVASGVFNGFTVDGTNAISFTISGAYTLDGAQWGVGPFKVLGGENGDADFLPTALDPDDHLFMIPTTIDPPEPPNGLVPFVPDAA